MAQNGGNRFRKNESGSGGYASFGPKGHCGPPRARRFVSVRVDERLRASHRLNGPAPAQSTWYVPPLAAPKTGRSLSLARTSDDRMMLVAAVIVCASLLLLFTTISNLVGNCTGRLPGFAPRRMRSTSVERAGRPVIAPLNDPLPPSGNETPLGPLGTKPPRNRSPPPRSFPGEIAGFAAADASVSGLSHPRGVCFPRVGGRRGGLVSRRGGLFPLVSRGLVSGGRGPRVARRAAYSSRRNDCGVHSIPCTSTGIYACKSSKFVLGARLVTR
jgi:hypothetical protein